MADLASSLFGQTISHYRVLQKLGGGGMGVFFKAEDTKFHRFVALMLLPGGFVPDAQALSRFHREAQAASALSHPNICTIHEISASTTASPAASLPTFLSPSVDTPRF
jgi:serine/threonine protein kinase